MPLQSSMQERDSFRSIDATSNVPASASTSQRTPASTSSARSYGHYSSSATIYAMQSSRTDSQERRLGNTWSPPASNSAVALRQYSPPPHSRPLYWTIPLPPENDSSEEFIPSTSSSRGASVQMHPHPRPILLHPLLSHAQLLPRSSSAQSSSPSSSTIPRSLQTTPPPNYRHLLHNYDVPATIPALGYLTLMIKATGQTLHIRPTSHSQYNNLVTVGDVFRVAEELFWFVQRACPSPRRNQGDVEECGCEKALMVVEPLLLWWTPNTT